MNIFYLLVSILLVGTPLENNTEPISAAEVATRMCDCGQKYKVTEMTTKYTTAKETESKEKAEKELAAVVRQMHECMDMEKIYTSTRALSSAERNQFEDQVMQKVTETCPMLAKALSAMK